MSALRKPDTLPQTEQADDRLLMLSAALDGETARAETEACITAMKHDEVLRQKWSEYHMVGDLMRGMAPVQDDFMARFSEQLAAEPTVLAPRRSVWPQRLAVALQATLTTAEAASLDVKTLFGLEQDLLNLADAIGLHYFPHGPNASRPEKLTGLA